GCPRTGARSRPGGEFRGPPPSYARGQGTTLRQAPAFALAPQGRHVDSQTLGGLSQRGGLRKDLLHVRPLHVPERTPALTDVPSAAAPGDQSTPPRRRCV